MRIARARVLLRVLRGREWTMRAPRMRARIRRVHEMRAGYRGRRVLLTRGEKKDGDPRARALHQHKSRTKRGADAHDYFLVARPPHLDREYNPRRILGATH